LSCIRYWERKAMKVSPEQYRREAELVERLAASISLRSDKQNLLAQAQTLRRRADHVEARLRSAPA